MLPPCLTSCWRDQSQGLHTRTHRRGTSLPERATVTVVVFREERRRGKQVGIVWTFIRIAEGSGHRQPVQNKSQLLTTLHLLGHYSRNKTRTSENVETMRPSCSAGGHKMMQPLQKTVRRFFTKLNNHHVMQKSYFWAYTSKRTESRVSRDVCAPMFIAALKATARRGSNTSVHQCMPWMPVTKGQML